MTKNFDKNYSSSDDEVSLSAVLRSYEERDAFKIILTEKISDGEIVNFSRLSSFLGGIQSEDDDEDTTPNERNYFDQVGKKSVLYEWDNNIYKNFFKRVFIFFEVPIVYKNLKKFWTIVDETRLTNINKSNVIDIVCYKKDVGRKDLGFFKDTFFETCKNFEDLINLYEITTEVVVYTLSTDEIIKEIKIEHKVCFVFNVFSNDKLFENVKLYKFFGRSGKFSCLRSFVDGKYSNNCCIFENGWKEFSLNDNI